MSVNGSVYPRSTTHSLSATGGAQLALAQPYHFNDVRGAHAQLAAGGAVAAVDRITRVAAATRRGNECVEGARGAVGERVQQRGAVQLARSSALLLRARQLRASLDVAQLHLRALRGVATQRALEIRELRLQRCDLLRARRVALDASIELGKEQNI